MKRPLCVIGGALLLSTAVSFLLTVENAVLLAVALSLTALLLWLTKPRHYFVGVVVFLAFSIGLLIGARYVETYYNPFIEFYDNTVQIKGFVKESRQTGGSQYRYLLEAEFPELPLPKTQFVLRDYGGEEFQVGETVHVTAKLQKPTYQNTEKYYRGQGISGEGILQEVESRRGEIIKFSHRFYKNREQLRAKIHKKNTHSLPKDTAALVNGMVFGMIEDLPSELYSAMNTVGTSHLISVSGLHLSIVVGAVLWLLEKLRFHRKFVYLGGMVGAVLFTLLVGARAPMIRSCVMSLVYLMGELIQEDSDSLTSLGLAAIITCVCFPYWVFSYGMWLSFLATGGIIVFGAPLVERLSQRYEKDGSVLSKIQQGTLSVLGITVGAYILTFPLLVFMNGILPLISPLANVLVSPFSTGMVIGGVVLAFIPSHLYIYKPIGWGVALCGRLITGISYQLSKLPFAGFSLDYSFLILLVFLCFIILVASYLLYKYKKMTVFKMAFLVCVILLASGKVLSVILAENQVEIVQFEEIETVLFLKGKTGVLVNPPNQYEMKNLLNYLSYRGITGIDGVYMTRSKGQIDSGLLELYDIYSPRIIITSENPITGQLLADSFLGVPVYLGTPNEVEILGLRVIINKDGDLVVAKQDKKERLPLENYDIIEIIPKDTVVITTDGSLEIENNRKVLKPFLGNRIYGEKRMLF